MHKEIAGMTNEEMFTAIISRMDSMESGLSGLSEQIEKVESGLSERIDNVESTLSERIDNVESGLNSLSGRIDNLESDMNMEFRAVRIEMDTLNKSLKGDISVLNDKIDRLMNIKDIDRYEKMQIQIDLLAQGYQQLKENIC